MYTHVLAPFNILLPSLKTRTRIHHVPTSRNGSKVYTNSHNQSRSALFTSGECNLASVVVTRGPSLRVRPVITAYQIVHIRLSLHHGQSCYDLLLCTAVSHSKREHMSKVTAMAGYASTIPSCRSRTGTPRSKGSTGVFLMDGAVAGAVSVHKTTGFQAFLHKFLPSSLIAMACP